MPWPDAEADDYVAKGYWAGIPLGTLLPHDTDYLKASARDFKRWAAEDFGVPDFYVLNIVELGGIRRTVEFVRACEQFGIGFWFHSGDTGVASAAYLQLSAALEPIREPSQALFHWYADDVIAEGPFSPQRGVLPVPDGPGLGVSLDQVALARCHERFLAEGGDGLRVVDLGERGGPFGRPLEPPRRAVANDRRLEPLSRLRVSRLRVGRLWVSQLRPSRLRLGGTSEWVSITHCGVTPVASQVPFCLTICTCIRKYCTVPAGACVFFVVSLSATRTVAVPAVGL